MNNKEKNTNRYEIIAIISSFLGITPAIFYLLSDYFEKSKKDLSVFFGASIFIIFLIYILVLANSSIKSSFSLSKNFLMYSVSIVLDLLFLIPWIFFNWLLYRLIDFFSTNGEIPLEIKTFIIYSFAVTTILPIIAIIVTDFIKFYRNN